MKHGRQQPGPESKIATKIGNALVSWTPFGGSSGLLLHALWQRDWPQSVVMFPVLLGTAAWANYSKNFIEIIGQSAAEKGGSDAKSLLKWLS